MTAGITLVLWFISALVTFPKHGLFSPYPSETIWWTLIPLLIIAVVPALSANRAHATRLRATAAAETTPRGTR